MKKLVTIVLSFLFITIHSAKAEMAIGITGANHMLEVSGTETTRQSAQKNTGSHDEDVMVPEIFVEAISDAGLAVGLSYIPTRELGKKSRTDSNSDGDSGTYKAEAELDNVIQLYVDVPVTDFGGQSVYLKGGVQHATIATLESLNSGSTYPDADVLGLTLGLGVKGDLPYGNFFYKADLTYTDFEDYSSDSDGSTGNKVVAELEDTAVKLSIGYKF
tara:strand:+ start:102 stop:752 length:651 start_codon:yes stop_codon:yes gene_type:complete